MKTWNNKPEDFVREIKTIIDIIGMYPSGITSKDVSDGLSDVWEVDKDVARSIVNGCIRWAVDADLVTRTTGTPMFCTLVSGTRTITEIDDLMEATKPTSLLRKIKEGRIKLANWIAEATKLGLVVPNETI